MTQATGPLTDTEHGRLIAVCLVFGIPSRFEYEGGRPPGDTWHPVYAKWDRGVAGDVAREVVVGTRSSADDAQLLANILQATHLAAIRMADLREGRTA